MAQDSVDKAIHWALGLQDSFLITAGDLQLLPRILLAVSRFEERPPDSEMSALVEAFDIQPIFSY